MRRSVAGIALPLIGFVLLALAAGAWWAASFFGAGPLEEERLVRLEPGIGVGGIADELERQGVVESAFAFKAGAALLGGALQAGEYLFAPGISAYRAMDAIRRGETYVRKLTVPEGLTTAQALALIEVAPGLEGPVPEGVAEGTLLPETYNYRYGDPRAQMVERMGAAMTRLLAELWAGRAPDLPFRSPGEALILASIVEKEAKLPEERARIAGVFVNRLERGMPLQADPTVAYALTAGNGPLGRPLSRTDLELDSPYNTYRYAGLPPAPIANPGRAALEATLHPLPTDELYFVAKGDGSHAFSRTLEEHNANVERYHASETAP